MDEFDELVRAIRLSFTVEQDDREGEDINVVDALQNIAFSLDKVARAINQQGQNHTGE